MTREESIKRLDEQAFKELEEGHWVEDIINGKAMYSCSECLHAVNYESCYHYCPYCGKELKGVMRNENNKSISAF